MLFLKILSLFVSLSVAQFHRETTLRTPRELPETAKTEKVRFVKIAIKSPVVFSNISGIFFTLLLHNSKKSSNFAVANESLQTYYKKRLLALVLV